MAKGIKIGITGLPDAGKTTTLTRVIRMLESDEKIVGGMITEAIMEDYKRVGFKIMDWMTREEGTLAHIDFDSGFQVGSYGVDLNVLETIGVNAINRASEEADVIVIDEVGKMEIESENFIASVRRALETDKPMLITLHKKSRNPLLQDIRRRDDVRILEVTVVNRDLLPYKVTSLMRGEFI